MTRAIVCELPGAQAAFSTRCDGVSDGPYDSLNLGILTDDAPDRVQHNRGLLARDIGLDPGAIAMGLQVHGTVISEWGKAPAAGGSSYGEPGPPPVEADGHVTDRAGLGLLVLAADCLPVALAGPGRVAMLHCGWRGVAAGIVGQGVELFDAPPAAVIGPGIGKCCFEVGPEVSEAFEDVPGAAAGRMLDLRAVVEARLRAAGVTEVAQVDLCTYCREDLFFSHRRDGGVTGRQAGVVWLTA